MLHFLHGLLEADEQRVRDDGVTDVQLIDAPDRGDGFGVVVMQAMAGIDDQAVAQTSLDAVTDSRQLAGAFSDAVRIGIAPGVQLDGRCTDGR